jgi:RNA polymerase sigma-70 factor (ECF subfamily)
MCPNNRKQDVNDKEKLSDESLLERFLKGEEWAFEMIIERHKDKVYGIAFSIVRNRAIAEDISEETFIKLYYKANTFKGRSKFTTWLYSVTSNTAKNHLRGINKKHSEIDIEDITTLKSSIAEPDKMAEASIINERINKALEKLPERQREVFVMRNLNGLSIEETAEVLGVTQGAVKANFSFAIKKLRELLEDLI